VMSYTASKTWVSDEAKEYDLFAKIRDNMPYIAPSSPFTPRTWAEWISHRLRMKEEAHREAVRRLEIKEAQKKMQTKEAIHSPLWGKEIQDYLSCVLSRESIWIPSTDSRPGRPQAPWPTYDELKHEGYHRNKSGYSRFPPLPRVPGNPTVNWKQRSPLAQFPFDEVGRPTLTGEELPPETDDMMMSLVGKELLEELDS